MISKSRKKRAKRIVKKYEEGSGVLTGDKIEEINNELDRIAKEMAAKKQAEYAAAQRDEQNKADKLNTANSVVNGVMNIGSSLLQGSTKVSGQSEATQAINSAYDTTADMVSKMGPWGAAAGAAMKVGGFACDALTAAGIGTDQMSVGDKILDSKFLKLTPVGLINALGAKKTQDFSVDEETMSQVGGSYGGTASDIEEAADKAGKKYGLFSKRARKKANSAIDKARQQQNLMTDIANEASDQSEMVNQMGDQASAAYDFQLTGGYKQQNMRAEQGGTLPKPSKFEPEVIIPQINIEKIKPISFKTGGQLDQIINTNSGQIEDFIPEIISTQEYTTWTPEIITDEPTFLQKGGMIEQQLDAPEIEETTQQNIIPEGALHKNKHHIEDADGMTKKGIPVVDDHQKQQAEIECNEIIFTKEVTQKLEELYHIYYNESSTPEEKTLAAIDTGKLLTKEIILNTDDRTGLIDSLQNGGVLDKSKSRSMDELIVYADSINPRFIQRLKEFPKILEFEREPGKKERGSHMLSYTTITIGIPGGSYEMAEVFPEIMEDSVGELRRYADPVEAAKRNDVLRMSIPEAEMFTKNYKKYYSRYMDIFDMLESYLDKHPDMSISDVSERLRKLLNKTDNE